MAKSKPSPDNALSPRDPFDPQFSIAELLAVANHFGFTIAPNVDDMFGACVLLDDQDREETDEAETVGQILRAEIARHGNELTFQLFGAFVWHSQLKAKILRAMPYDQYLRSKHWAEMRQEALERASYSCQICNASDNLHVHHRTYERRGEEAPDDLTVLCSKCHKLFHENGRVK